MFLLLTALALFLGTSTAVNSTYNLDLYRGALVQREYPSFSVWSEQNGRNYLTPTERDYRESVFNRNVAMIARHNSHGHPWKLAVNKFADLTRKEFAQLYVTGGYMNYTRPRRIDWSMPRVTNVSALPASVDWSSKGAVTPVKDQGQCGSCWAFSSTGALEGAWFLKNKTLVSLSEQQLVDCSTAQGNQGCDGGLMDDAFQYVISNKGLTTEAAYPYTATGPNTCVSSGLPVAATARAFTDVPTNSMLSLMTAVVQQPVSVAIEADQSVFQFYSSGVLTQSCGTNLDHGVLLVGYGTLGGLDYYKVKNSWGLDWGMKGYVLLGRGSMYNGGQGQCGIQMDPSYPVV